MRERCRRRQRGAILRTSTSAAAALALTLLALLLAAPSSATTLAAPANDNFSAAQIVSGATGTVSGTNLGASKETGEPNHAGRPGGHSIWYRWTALASGPVAVDTAGTTFDSLLGVYTGFAVNALAVVASNDDISFYTRQSRTTFTAVAGTTYQVAVDGKAGATGAVALAWTQLLPSADPQLLAAGDIAGCETRGDEATAAIVGANPNATVATMGDSVHEDGRASLFTDCYDPSWGAFKARTHPSVGNHEYLTPGAAGYFSYFGALAGDAAKGYYSYDLGSWHVVVLNSNCSYIGGCGAGSDEEIWLRADLAANRSRCTLAYWHHSRFSSGSGRVADNTVLPFWQALSDYGADLILNGHHHAYERFALQTPAGKRDDARGIREIVAGTGGYSYEYFGLPAANSQVRITDEYGVLRLTLHSGSYDWQFLPETGKTIGDSGSTACHLASPTVRLRNFSALARPHSVALRWRTASETGIRGFNIIRIAGRHAVRLNRKLLRAKAMGTFADGTYRFVDRHVRPGSSYTYRLQAVNLNGTRSWIGSSRVRTPAP